MSKVDDNPYGLWHCRDGSIVLFDRSYKPILRNSIDGIVTELDPTDRPEDVVSEVFFYDDGTKNPIVRHMGFIRDSFVKSGNIIASRQAANEGACHG